MSPEDEAFLKRDAGLMGSAELMRGFRDSDRLGKLPSVRIAYEPF